MEFLKLYQQYILKTEITISLLDGSSPDIEAEFKKKKSKKEAQEEEEEAFKRGAASFLSENPLIKK